MDCAQRGLTVAIVERDDFAAGTSGRSTKLIHGGIRYLAQAFQSQIPPQSLADVFRHARFDSSYLAVVSHDLAERAFMIQSAPFMTRPLPMMIPLYVVQCVHTPFMTRHVPMMIPLYVIQCMHTYDDMFDGCEGYGVSWRIGVHCGM